MMLYIDWGFRALLVTVFLTAVVGKTRTGKAYTAFAESLIGFPWIPYAVRHLIPVGVIGTETVVVVLLPVPAAADYGFALAFGLLIAFTGAVAWSLHRGEQVNCLCFGSDAGPMGRGQLARNLLLAAAAAAGFWADVFGHEDRALVLGVVAAIGAGALTGLYVTRWNDLMSILSPVRSDGGARVN
jgi:hypothetical protein